jgi:hypothetical protein
MSMQQQQEQKGFWHDMKVNWNVGFTVSLAHQRAVCGPLRTRHGQQALAWPCVHAAILMVVWAVLSRDGWMWAYIGFWMLCQLRNRIEAAWLSLKGIQIHSFYDGFTTQTIRFGGSERVAKLIVEPMLAGTIGAILYWVYAQANMRPYGLPYFYRSGLFTLSFVELVKQEIWKRKTQSMLDARLEQEMVMRDYRRKYGD